jgi:uncharacterized protein
LVYRVLNATRNRELGDRVHRADGFVSRFLGLMGRGGLPPGGGLHITPCNGIHMLFMRFPIDAAFLGADGEVVKLFHTLRPWRVTSIFREARSVLELPAGILATTDTRPGDRLVFQGAPS